MLTLLFVSSEVPPLVFACFGCYYTVAITYYWSSLGGQLAGTPCITSTWLMQGAWRLVEVDPDHARISYRFMFLIILANNQQYGAHFPLTIYSINKILAHMTPFKEHIVKFSLFYYCSLEKCFTILCISNNIHGILIILSLSRRHLTLSDLWLLFVHLL